MSGFEDFEGHLNFVNQVVPYREDQILSCSDDYTCRLWQMAVPRWSFLAISKSLGAGSAGRAALHVPFRDWGT